MESAILQAKSGNDLKLILQLAKKLGFSAKKLSEEEILDLGLSIAITEGRTGEFTDVDEFLKTLQYGSKD
jgi:hypothetical protein